MGLGAPELILIIIVVLVLFGGKKIPEMMRGMGRGMKEFKDAQNGDTTAPTTTTTNTTAASDDKPRV